MSKSVSRDQLTFARGLRRDMTRAEEVLWTCLRGRRLNQAKFRRQAPIGPYVADFVCFDARLIVELDGAPHEHPEQKEKDLSRDAWFRGNNFKVLRFTNEQAMMSTDFVLQDIRSALQQPG